VLRAELYAVAALVGASVVVIGHTLQLPSAPVALVGAGLCFGLRLMAIRRGWHLPRAWHSDRPPFGTDPRNKRARDRTNAARDTADSESNT
jgi:hypothetical protein